MMLALAAARIHPLLTRIGRVFVPSRKIVEASEDEVVGAGIQTKVRILPGANPDLRIDTIQTHLT